MTGGHGEIDNIRFNELSIIQDAIDMLNVKIQA